MSDLLTIGASGAAYPLEDPRLGNVSWLSQELLNYYDDADHRTRCVPYTLEHQWLNSLAGSIEQSRLVADREVRSVVPERVPLNLDRSGLYYQVQLPSPVTSFYRVEGDKGQGWVELCPYDDLLPVPTGIRRDTSRQPVACRETDLLLATVEGSGDPETVGPFQPPLSGPVYLTVQAASTERLFIRVNVRGELDPPVCWAGRDEDGESLVLRRESVYVTQKSWKRISSLSFSEIPAGVTITVHSGPVLVGEQEDRLQPYIHPLDRGKEYPRYWRLANGNLQETYLAGPWAGHEVVREYEGDRSWDWLALEPNTYGMLVGSGTYLYYCDRRVPLPDRLENTGLVREPFYFLEAKLLTLPDSRRLVELTPHPGAGAANVRRHRYRVQLPDGVEWIWTPDGGLSELDDKAGYRAGAPQVSLFPVPAAGTYLIFLECENTAGDLASDVVVYQQHRVQPVTRLDCAAMVPQVRGLLFDGYQRAWLWTGEFLIPVQFDYDQYIYVEGQRSLYLTDNYAQVRLRL